MGEELNQLLRQGFHVFRDLPFDDFNIDHVIVGRAGVYSVETKTRRKPNAVSGKAKATITFDGSSLVFPNFPNFRSDEALKQARLNAETLSRWIWKSAGERVRVKPILTFPGWWIDRRALGDVNVLNPVEIKRSFPSRIETPLEEAQIQRIVFQLTERCRMKSINATG